MKAAAATVKRSTAAATALNGPDDKNSRGVDDMTLLMSSVICAAAGREAFYRQFSAKVRSFGLGFWVDWLDLTVIFETP